MLILGLHYCVGNVFRQGRCQPTSPDILGPYYVPNPPRLLQYCTGDHERFSHDRLLVNGYVYRSDCTSPMANARIDVWQADHSGNYSVGAKCRGYLKTDSLGYYEFTTLYPGKYHINNGEKRPAHIHFKVYGRRRHKTLVTQMYFAGDSNLGVNDPCTVCGSSHQDLINPVQVLCDEENPSDCIQVIRFDIVMERGRGISQIQ